MPADRTARNDTQCSQWFRASLLIPATAVPLLQKSPFTRTYEEGNRCAFEKRKQESYVAALVVADVGRSGKVVEASGTSRSVGETVGVRHSAHAYFETAVDARAADGGRRHVVCRGRGGTGHVPQFTCHQLGDGSRCERQRAEHRAGGLIRADPVNCAGVGKRDYLAAAGSIRLDDGNGARTEVR
jgi:hypothetical protein